MSYHYAGKLGDVRFWRLADIDADAEHVRFWGQIDNDDEGTRRRLMTQSRHPREFAPSGNR
jgi:hypothetical protein